MSPRDTLPPIGASELLSFGRDELIERIGGHLVDGVPVTLLGLPGVGRRHLVAAVIAAHDAPHAATLLRVADRPSGRPGEVLIDVPPLAHADAAALLAAAIARAGRPLPPTDLLHQLARAVDGFPAGLVSIARRLRAWSPEALADAVEADPAVLDADADGLWSGWQTALQTLSPAEVALLDAMAAFDGALGPAHVARLLETNAIDAVARGLEQLGHRGWLEAAGHLLRVRPLVRRFVRARGAKLDPQAIAAVVGDRVLRLAATGTSDPFEAIAPDVLGRLASLDDVVLAAWSRCVERYGDGDHASALLRALEGRLGPTADLVRAVLHARAADGPSLRAVRARLAEPPPTLARYLDLRLAEIERDADAIRAIGRAAVQAGPVDDWAITTLLVLAPHLGALGEEDLSHRALHLAEQAATDDAARARVRKQREHVRALGRAHADGLEESAQGMLARAASQPPDAAWGALGLTLEAAYRRLALGRLGEARPMLDASLPVVRRRGNALTLSRALLARSAVAVATGDLAGAEAWLDEATAVVVPDSAFRVDLGVQEVLVHLLRGELVRAGVLLDTLQARPDLPRHPAAVFAWCERGVLDRVRGDDAGAARAFDAARAAYATHASAAYRDALSCWVEILGPLGDPNPTAWRDGVKPLVGCAFVRFQARMAVVLLERALPPMAAPPSGHAVLWGPNAAWVQVPGGPRVSLAKRPSLRALVAGLVTRHLDDPDARLPVSEAVAIGWPGERLLAEAGASRVYTAVRTLRREGLDPVWVTDEGGYGLCAHATIVPMGGSGAGR